MSFGIFRDGNIATVGDVDGGEPGVGTDEFAVLSFDLQVNRTTPQSEFRFSYRPSYAAYHNNKELDYFANALVVGYVRTPTEVSRFTVDGFVARTDHQGQRPYAPDSATTFVPRTTETTGRIAVGGTVAAGPRGLVDWYARAEGRGYEDLADNPATTVLVPPVTGVNVPDPVDFINSVEATAGAAWRFRYSERGSVGVFLEVSAFEYEDSTVQLTPGVFSDQDTPGVVVESLGVTGTYEASWNSTFTYSAGAFRASSEGDSVTDPTIDAEIRYPIDQSSNLAAGVRQTCSPGTGLAATTRDRGAWISYAHTAEVRGISGTVLAGYWQREALLSSAGDASTTSTSVTGTIGWSFNRYVGLNGAYSFIDQSSGGGAPSSLDTNYSSYGIYLRWAIRGL